MDRRLGRFHATGDGTGTGQSLRDARSDGELPEPALRQMSRLSPPIPVRSSARLGSCARAASGRSACDKAWSRCCEQVLVERAGRGAGGDAELIAQTAPELAVDAQGFGHVVLCSQGRHEMAVAALPQRNKPDKLAALAAQDNVAEALGVYSQLRG